LRAFRQTFIAQAMNPWSNCTTTESQDSYRGFARMIADHESANFKLSRVNRRILIRVNQRWSAVRIFGFSPCLRASVVDVLPAAE